MTLPFIYGEHCEICNVKGVYDFDGEYLCEECYRYEIDPKREEELEDYPDYKEICPCGECRCGKKEESHHNWLI